MRRGLSGFNITSVALGLAFLYLPILVVVVMSFNASKNPFVWSGFSLKWYPELLKDPDIMGGLRTTLIVATGATIISVILGTLLAFALERVLPSRALDAAATAPAVMPDIVLAIGLLAFYTLVGITLSAVSVMLAHAVFGIAFVAAVVRVRLAGMDRSLEEASRDLGASAMRTFAKVTLPGLRPAIIAGALLAFTLSTGIRAAGTDDWSTVVDRSSHRARIAGKRLRYLLEPLDGVVTGVPVAFTTQAPFRSSTSVG